MALTLNLSFFGLINAAFRKLTSALVRLFSWILVKLIVWMSIPAEGKEVVRIPILIDNPQTTTELKSRTMNKLLDDTQIDRNFGKQVIESFQDNKLPQEILGLVFNNCLQDRTTLLNCRLVCKRWNNSVQYSPSIMRRLTFTIYDWRSFILNDSTTDSIIDHMKSVKIIVPWTVDAKDKYWLEFAARLGQSVEKITFDPSGFNTSSKVLGLMMNGSAEIIRSVLSSCPRVTHLSILNRHIWTSLDTFCPNLFQDDLQHISVNLKTLELFTDAETLRKVIFWFPNLYSIKIENTHAEDGHARIRSVLRRYIKQNINGSGSLKKISLDGLGHRNPRSWLKFVFTCANFGILIEYCRNYDLVLDAGNIDSFFAYVETPEAPLNENTCQYFGEASLEIEDDDGPMVNNDRLGFCRNIKQLQIDFYRNCTIEEVRFISKLDKLQILTLVNAFEDEEEDNHNDNENAAELMFPCEVFEQSACPSLHHLLVAGDLFGTTQQQAALAFSSFYSYFPNLKYLIFDALEFMPTDIFVHLSKMEFLEQITFFNHEGPCFFTDEMFTLLCKSQRTTNSTADEDEEEEFVPAITAFKNLKQLYMSGCPFLTDLCIVDGIALSQTLTDITLGGIMNQLTEVSLHVLENNNFVMDGESNNFDFKRVA